MRRIPLNPIAPGSANGGIIIAPPPGGTGVAPCTCSDLAIVWSDGTTSAAAIVGDTALPVLVASGTICADTAWTITSNWDPEDAGAAPVVEQVGASAWSVTAPASGILTLSASALCGGQTLAVGSVTLTIIEGAIYSGGGGQWVDITTLPGVTFELIDDAGPSAAKITRSGSKFTDTGTGLRQINGSVEYPAAARGLRVHGLIPAAGAVYARLRVRIESFVNGSDYDGYACGVLISGHTTIADTVTILLNPVDLGALVVSAGVNATGDGAGSFSFAVDVEVVT